MAIKLFAGAVLAAAMLAGAPALAQAANPAGGLINHYDDKVFRQIITDMGHKLIQPVDLSGDKPFLVFEDKMGQLYGVLATACHNEGGKQTCYGAQLIADMAPPAGVKSRALVDQFNETYAAAKFFFVDGKVRLSRYLILDDGITPANLRANLQFMTEMAGQVASELKPG